MDAPEERDVDLEERKRGGGHKRGYGDLPGILPALCLQDPERDPDAGKGKDPPDKDPGKRKCPVFKMDVCHGLFTPGLKVALCLNIIDPGKIKT